MLLQHFFRFQQSDAPVVFDTVLHLGSLVAVLAVFRVDLLAIIRAVATLREDGLRQGWRKRPHLRLLIWMALATLPAVIVGVTWEKTIEAAFTSVRVVGVAWLVTAALLLISHFFRHGKTGVEKLGAGQALLVGVFQAAAIIPGLSRSGATIVSGMIGGLDRETAARFSFLIAIPAIIGAGLLELLDAPPLPAGFATAALVGFAASVAVGYLALRLLLRFVRQGRLHWFGFYCMLVGIIAIVM